MARKTSLFGRHKCSWRAPQHSSKVPSGVTLTNAAAQTRNAVVRLTALLFVTTPAWTKRAKSLYKHVINVTGHVLYKWQYGT